MMRSLNRPICAVFAMCVIVYAQEQDLSVKFEDGSTRYVVGGARDLLFKCTINRGLMFVVSNTIEIARVRYSGEEDILTRSGKIINPDTQYYEVNVLPVSNDKIEVAFKISEVRDIDDGTLLCRVTTENPDRVIEDRVEVVVLRPLTSVSIRFANKPALFYNTNVPLAVDAGRYSVRCIAEGSNPPAEKIYMTQAGEMVSHSVPVEEIIDGDVRTFRVTITGQLDLTKANSGDIFECSAESKLGDTLSTEFPIKINIYEPEIMCNDSMAYKGKMHPTLECNVDHEGLNITGFGYQLDDKGGPHYEIVMVGDQNDDLVTVKEERISASETKSSRETESGDVIADTATESTKDTSGHDVTAVNTSGSEVTQGETSGCDVTSGETSPVCSGHERAVSIQDTVQWLDIREEGIATLLSYMELHPAGWLENYNHTYAKCTIRCYGGPRQLMDVARKCPPVAVAIARQKLEGRTFSDSSHLELRVVDICDSMGWQSATVKRQLKDLQWESGPLGFRKSGVLVELSDLAFHFRSRGDLTSNEMDGVLDFLSDRVLSQERAELTQLDMLSDALWSVSHKNYWMCCDEADKERSDNLKTKLEDFFHSRGRGGLQGERQSSDAVVDVTDSASINQLTSDIRHFISLYGQDHTLTGRAIARIFHGIASPCFPAETWGRVRRFWRAHLHLDFNLIIREATRLIVAMK